MVEILDTGGYNNKNNCCRLESVDGKLRVVHPAVLPLPVQAPVIPAKIYDFFFFFKYLFMKQKKEK